MGIITKITDEITTTGYPSIKSLLEESVEWEGYIHGDYQETKRKENTPIGAKTQTSDDDPDEQNSEEIVITFLFYFKFFLYFHIFICN